MKILIVLFLSMLTSGCYNVGTLCLMQCGDRRNIELSDLHVTRIEKSLAKSGKVHVVTLKLKFASNYNLEESRQAYQASYFGLIDPLFDAVKNHKSVSAHVIVDKGNKLADRRFIYNAVIVLRKKTKDASSENYDRALAMVEKDGGLYFRPSMVRMFSSPVYLQFKEVFVPVDIERLRVGDGEWEQTVYPLARTTDVSCSTNN